MKEWQGVAINGAIFGAIFGAGYHLYMHRSGGLAAAASIDLLTSVLVGAAAGALAFIVRRSTR